MKFVSQFLITPLLFILTLCRVNAQEYCGAIIPDSVVARMDELQPTVNFFTDQWMLQRQQAADNGSVVQIPLKIHIVSESNGTGGLDPNEVDDMLDEVNAFYAPGGFVFFLCGDIAFVNNSTYYDFDESEENGLFALSYVENVINVYFVGNVTMGGNQPFCGYANFPFQNVEEDFVMVANSCGSNTLAHELAHYFGVYHTHGAVNVGCSTDEFVNGSNCDAAGDRVCDTPADPGISSVCNTVNNCQYVGAAQDINGQYYNPNVQNLMSYAPQYCRNHFTAGQFARMAYYRQNYRANLACAIGGGGSCSGQTNLADCTGTINDGSGNDPYGNLLNCSWLIQPAGASSVTLTFSAFETEPDYDFVSIFNGTDANAPLLGTFSGNALPPSITANSGKMFITFSSDETVAGAGWAASYSCSNGGGGGGACAGQTTLTDCTGTISDGSGNDLYGNLLNCSWLIQPAGASSVTLTFSAFETEPDYDFVSIFNGTDANAPLLGTFSGNALPPSITANSGKMFITFSSDETVAGAGWTASYSCSNGGGCTFSPHVTVNNCYLTAPAGSNYQWYKNGVAIPGATEQSYAATANASYRVKMTDPNGCQGESQLVLVFCLTDAEEVEEEARLYLAPNPAHDEAVISWNNWSNIGAQLEVLAPDGRLTDRWLVEKSEAGQFALPVAGWPNGVYIVRFGDRTQRLVVQH